MATFSRTINTASTARGPQDWALLTVLAVVALWLVLRHPVIVPIVAILAVLGWALDRGRVKRHLAIAADRKGESICTYARAFPRRERDPWVLRAVYQELQPYALFPLRPSDRLTEALEVDGEDLDDIARDVARITKRDLSRGTASPYYGRVHTVGDLVRFLQTLPPKAAG